MRFLNFSYVFRTKLSSNNWKELHKVYAFQVILYEQRRTRKNNLNF